MGEQEDAGSRPQRRVYRPTALGRGTVERWAREPVTHPRDMRIDFPLKLYVARQLGPERAADLIDRQRAVFEEYIARLQSEQISAGSDDDAAFIDLMRTGRIGRAQAALDWLDSC